MELFHLVRSENVERIKALLRDKPAGFDINLKNEAGQTSLYWATELPKTDIAKLLIQAGADLNATEQHGFTCLHLAAFIGNEDMAQLLLDSGASSNQKNNSGSTPLHLAAKNNHAHIVRLLLRSGAEKNVRDDKGSLPIDYAKIPDVLKAFQTGSLPAPSSPPPTESGSAIMSPASPTSASTPTKPPLSESKSSSALSQKEKMLQLQKTLTASQDTTVLRKIGMVLTETILSEQVKLTKGSELLSHEKAKSLCQKCTQEHRDMVLVPCMHLLYCGKCVLQFNGSCPSCNTRIEGRLKIARE